MDIPIKFIWAWLFIIIITYAVTGYVYSTTIEGSPEMEIEETGDLSLIDIVAGAVKWFVNTLTALFRVFFFALPEMPIIVSLVINLIIQPINIIWLMGIYPFIRDLAHLVIEAGKTVIELIDAIIPF